MQDGKLKKSAALVGGGVFLFLIIIDQFTKNFAGEVYRNFYFAFSLPVPIYLMYTIYLVGIGTIIIYLFKHSQSLLPGDLLAWLIILAGAMSNVGERIIFGFVKDFIYIGSGVFNLADFYIILGVIILIIKIPINK